MQITYIYHSGFLIETAGCYYLFDYYKGELPGMNPGKPVLVFASHRHPDHYNPQVFERLKDLGMKHISAILSKDIPKRNYPLDTDTLTVGFYQEYELPCHGGRLYTLHSTDQGVAFVITCHEGVIYHAGDLNDWVWAGETDTYNRQMTGSYRHEIKVLQEYLSDTSVDIAMLPLDPRQEPDYDRGMLYFLQKIPTKKAFPMHYWEKSDVIQQFTEAHPEYQDIVQNTESFCVRL